MFFRNTTNNVFRYPKRILIVRLSAIGDAVHSLPVLVTLRTRFPHAEIAWLTETPTSKLLLGHWALDRLIIVKKNWMKSWTETTFLRKRLRSFAPDITIDVQGLLKSSFAAWLSGAKHRIGFGGIDGREGSQWFNNCRVTSDDNHVVDRNLCLLQPFNVCGSSVDFDLPECEMDNRTASKILTQKGLHGHFAMLNVGAGWESRLWREDRYAEVAKYLLEQWNLPSLVVWAGETEQKKAETVVQATDGAAFLAPQTTLGELVALSRKATLFIGSDTGPLHIAAAVGTHCIGLHGPTQSKRTGPYGKQNRTIQIQNLENTRIRPRRASRALMDAITAAIVCQTCDEILETILPSNNVTNTERYHYPPTERKAA
jgi:lipopolysaccharide heptosyltransferase I